MERDEWLPSKQSWMNPGSCRTTCRRKFPWKFGPSEVCASNRSCCACDYDGDGRIMTMDLAVANWSRRSRVILGNLRFALFQRRSPALGESLGWGHWRLGEDMPLSSGCGSLEQPHLFTVGLLF
jgi:hypothetical protein